MRGIDAAVAAIERERRARRAEALRRARASGHKRLACTVCGAAQGDWCTDLRDGHWHGTRTKHLHEPRLLAACIEVFRELGSADGPEHPPRA